MTTALPRLPHGLRAAGASVAVRLPAVPGSVAHRAAHDQRPTKSKVFGAPTTQRVTVAACAQDDDPCAEMTAAWADFLGAQACTEEACWPDAGLETRPLVDEPVPAAVPPVEHDQAAPVPDHWPATAAALGIRPDTPVWIAAARRDIEAHRVDGPVTGCGRSTRTGERLIAQGAHTRHQPRWCRRCWPRQA
jgi:hypothetical protein